jgi:hypothetical protein
VQIACNLQLNSKGAFAWRATLDEICPSTFFGTRSPVSLFGRVDVATQFFIWYDG